MGDSKFGFSERDNNKKKMAKKTLTGKSLVS